MKRGFVILFIFSASSSRAQEKAISLRAYIAPNFSHSAILHKAREGANTSTSLTHKGEISYGFGLELLRSLPNKFFIGGDVGFIMKGNAAVENITYYSNGNVAGRSYQESSLSFMQAMLF